MKNTLLSIKTISLLVAISAPVFTFVYLAYSNSKVFYFLPLPTSFQLENTLYKSALFSWCLFLPATIGISFIFKTQKQYQILTIFTGFIIGITACCLYSIPAIFSSHKRIVDTEQLNGHKYNLVMDGGVSDLERSYTLITIYECDNNDKKCDEIYGERHEWYIRNAQLVVDEFRQEIHLFYIESPISKLIFSYGKNSQYYDWEDTETIDTKEFSLYSYQLENSKIFVLAMCDETDTEAVYCTVLPFQYSTRSNKEGLLLQNNEGIQVVVNDKKVYVYGIYPRCYEEGCIIYK
jgi:hypothetical protein